MTIRRLVPADLSAFRALWLDGLARLPEAFLLTEAEAAATPDTTILAGIRAGTHWGAFANGDLVAIGVLRRGGPVRLRHTGDLGPFYVHPDFQGRGLASDLLAAMLQAAKDEGMMQVELCVDVTNARAIRLYERHGFHQFGLRPRSVILEGVPRDDVLMMVQFDQTAPA